MNYLVQECLTTIGLRQRRRTDDSPVGVGREQSSKGLPVPACHRSKLAWTSALFSAVSVKLDMLCPPNTCLRPPLHLALAARHPARLGPDGVGPAATSRCRNDPNSSTSHREGVPRARGDRRHVLCFHPPLTCGPITDGYISAGWLSAERWHGRRSTVHQSRMGEKRQ
jgi:hypothetical protein